MIDDERLFSADDVVRFCAFIGTVMLLVGFIAGCSVILNWQ